MEIYPKPPSYYYLSTRGNPVVRFTRIFKSIYKCAQEKEKHKGKHGVLEATTDKNL